MLNLSLSIIRMSILSPLAESNQRTMLKLNKSPAQWIASEMALDDSWEDVSLLVELKHRL